jgi:hypothetical protein
VAKLVGGQLDALTAVELGESGADLRLVFSRGADELRIRSRTAGPIWRVTSGGSCNAFGINAQRVSSLVRALSRSSRLTKPFERVREGLYPESEALNPESEALNPGERRP